MIKVETQTTEVEVINNVEVTSTSQVEVETVDLSNLDITVAKKEYVITGDNIYIPILYDDAPQWMKDLVQVVVDVSISSGNQSLINNMNAILQDFAVSYVPLNQYTQSILDLGDEDTRLNGLIETLNSNFNDGLSTANAQITSLQLTKASKDEVVAQVIQTIAAQLADGASNIGSTIGRIDQAIADETSARATSFQVLTSSLEDTNLDVTANAAATSALNTYVGLELGAPNGTGLLADVEILQKQNDGIIETTTGTYDVMISPENPDLAQLVVTAEPYVTWKASDVTGIDTRLAHIGDVYIKYADTTNGAKEYIASYKFIRTVIDNTSPYATDTDGFTWALIVDQAAQDAYEQALNAFDLADGKITSYYTSTYASMLAISDGWTTEEKLRNTGDLAVVWDDTTIDNNGTWRWNGTSWVTTRDKKLVALASDVTALSTELDNGTNTWASADSTLENSLLTEITDEGARVESKFAYNSLLNINGIYKKSGFGLTTNYVSGSGTQIDPYVSEFWIDASRLKFTNSNVTGSVTPFTIDASGVTPQIEFNGRVSFGSIYDQTIIQNGYINTGLIQANTINANQINTVGLIAENISAEEISGKIITGGQIIGANIAGVTIRASYLDLDGELEVLTNFYLCVGGDTTGVPALAISEGRYRTYNIADIDAVPSTAYSNLYRIPSISTVREETKVQTLNFTGASLISKIRSYNCANASHNVKCVKVRPSAFVSGFNIFLSLTLGDENDGYRNSSTAEMYFGGVLLGSVYFRAYYYNWAEGADQTYFGVSGSIEVYLNGGLIYSYTDSDTESYNNPAYINPPSLNTTRTVNGVVIRISCGSWSDLSFSIDNGEYELPSDFNNINESLFRVVNGNDTAYSLIRAYTNSATYINNMI